MKKIITTIALLTGCWWSNAQNGDPAARKDWHYAGPHVSIRNAQENDWYYQIVNTVDGGSVGAGYTSFDLTIPCDNPNPQFDIHKASINKLNSKGEKLWDAAFNNTNSQSRCNFYDIIEVQDGYVAIGNYIDVCPARAGNYTTSGLQLVKVDKTNGTLIFSQIITNAFLNWADLQKYPGGRPSIRCVYNNGNEDGFIITCTAIDGPNSFINPGGCASACAQSRGAALIRLDNNFNPDPTFGGGDGNEIYFETAIRAPQFNGAFDPLDVVWSQNARIIYDPATNNPIGYMVYGMILSKSLSFPVDFGGGTIVPFYNINDLLIIRADLNGSLINSTMILEADLINAGYVDNPTTPYCTDQYNGLPSGSKNETSSMLCADIEQIPGTTNFILSSYADYYRSENQNCVNANLPSGKRYVDSDLAVFEIDGNSLQPVWATQPTHFSGIDYFPALIIDQRGDYIVAASTYDVDPDFVYARAVKIDHITHANKWIRDVKGPGVDANCIFALTYVPDDDGCIMAGNNYNEPSPNVYEDDYLAIKLYSDCQTTLASNNSNWDIYQNTNIAGNIHWNGFKRVKGIINVLPGSTLTIDNGARIEFANSYHLNDFDYLSQNAPGTSTTGDYDPTKIRVQKGGTLIIKEGAVLKGITDCDKSWMWEGVEILGDRNLDQKGTQNQGRISFDRGGTIQDAYLGTALGATAYNDLGKVFMTGEFGGGLIFSGRGNHVNCLNSVQFAPYISPLSPKVNYSTFAEHNFECNNFILDQDYRNPAGTRLGNNIFLYMPDVHGVTVRGTAFNNTYTIANMFAGNGIESMDADFTAGPMCNIVTQSGQCAGTECRFTNLNKGIFAMNVNSSLNTFSVTGSLFTNNAIGVDMTNVNLADIHQNRFTIGLGAGNTGKGISMFNCTGYTIEENIFDQPGLQGTTNGIEGYNPTTNTYTDRIYNNTFSNLTQGILAYGYFNGNGSFQQGLKIKCNDFYDNQYDVRDFAFGGGGISIRQGAPGPDTKAPAGNTFNNPCINIQGHLQNVFGSSYTYYFHQPNDVTDPHQTNGCTNASPVIVTSSTNITFDKPQSCPSNFGSGGHDEGLRAAAQNNGQQGEALLQQIDGGDKAGLLSAIQIGTSSQKKTVLLNQSPYLSEEVLNTAIDNANLTAIDLHDVVMANSKDVTVAQPIIDPNGEPPLANAETVVENIDEVTMPAQLKYEMQIAQEGFSKKQELYATAGHYLSNEQMYIDKYITSYLTDTVDSIPYDSIADILASQTAAHRQLQLAAAYQANGNYAAALAARNAAIQTDATLTDYVYLQNLLASLKQNNQTVFDLRNNATVRSLVEAIANDITNAGCAAARAIMHHVYGVDYSVELPDENGNRVVSSSKKKRAIVKPIEDALQVQPNPFISATNITAYVNSNNKTVLCITDAYGKTLHTYNLIEGKNDITLSSVNLSPGMYYAVLKTNGMVQKKQKIVCTD